jgi:hypothetical protein
LVNLISTLLSSCSLRLLDTLLIFLAPCGSLLLILLGGINALLDETDNSEDEAQEDNQKSDEYDATLAVLKDCVRHCEDQLNLKFLYIRRSS